MAIGDFKRFLAQLIITIDADRGGIEVRVTTIDTEPFDGILG
jgi:hypothetical protein